MAEIVKTGQFHVKTKYSVWYEGAPNRSDFRESHVEIPTFAPASLVVEAVERVRRIVECEGLTRRDVSLRYGRAVREAAYRHVLRWVPLFPGEHDVYTVLYRSVYGSLALYWYCPATVSTSIYLATIEGHRYIREAPSAERRDQLARAAHYFDYVIADGAGKIDQRRGIRLGEPDVEVLSVFKERMRSEESKDGVVGGDRSALVQEEVEALTDVSPLSSKKDQEARGCGCHDAMVAGEQQGGVLLPEGRPMQSLEQLHLSAETQAVLQEAIALTGAPDLFSYLLEVGVRDARQLCRQARRGERERYGALPTSKLVGMKVPEAGHERYRRAVYTLMQWNKTHGPLEQWSITTLSIQKLVGGRKEAINTYLEAYHEEIAEHHRKLDIKPSYNRKAEPITEMITIAEEPTAFPWGKAVALQEDRVSMAGDDVHAT
ncbi:protelomerase family protein [Ktedonobacter robiniae]|nr:protelomerase family protein [Ktedonobacter robiniae]